MRGEITTFIKKAARENNRNGFFREPLVGFSSAHNPAYAELKTIIGEHHDLPTDILPAAETVISFFVPFSLAVVKSNRQGPLASREWVEAYIACNALINNTCAGLVDRLTARGMAATTIRSTHTFDPVTLKTAWSHKSAACISGLGRFGRNRQIITAGGCAGRCGTVFTALPLPADPRPQREMCLFYTRGACSYCIDHCPVRALDETSIDRQKCHARLLENDGLYPDLETCDVCGKCSVGPCAYFAA